MQNIHRSLGLGITDTTTSITKKDMGSMQANTAKWQQVYLRQWTIPAGLLVAILLRQVLGRVAAPSAKLALRKLSQSRLGRPILRC